jgi:predicted nucleic acid-binding protein
MATPAYADSSFLFSLVAKDSWTGEATSYMVRAAFPLLFTPLHRIELRNALHNATGRGEITEEVCRGAFALIEEDLHEGVLVHAPIEWTNVFRRADELSAKHAGREGQRTIDLLHVAIAIERDAKIFVSFDRRQKKLALAAGLKVKP